MATTTLQPRTLAMPNIHLGSFSPYPAMSATDSVPFPADTTVPLPVFRDSPFPSASSPRSPAHWRPPAALAVSYPPTPSFAYPSFTPSRTPPRSPPPGSAFYSNSSPMPPQPQPQPQQTPAPRDVCVECMMRDEDMADVDVTSPGAWDRESDVHYHTLCAQEEERTATSDDASDDRPRAHGIMLTEANVKIWLSLNPREPASKQQTLHTYLNAQNELLAAECRARLQALKESRQIDDKLRDTFSQLRRAAPPEADDPDLAGIRIRSPSTDDVNANHRRRRSAATLLENGLIVERVDVRKEDARLRKEERRARKASRDSLRDAASLYDGAASLRALDHAASVSVPMLTASTSRSVRSMYTTPSASWQSQSHSRPLSMAMPHDPAFASQPSLESPSSPRRRFFGFRHLSGYFGSSTSLAPSGSMVDMHLGLDQEKYLAHLPHIDIGSNAPSLREAWPRLDEKSSRPPDHPATDDRASSKKKRRGLVHLWRLMTGTHHKTPRTAPAPAPMVAFPAPNPQDLEDENTPLAPPPPLSYLVNRGSAQPERAVGGGGGTGRHQSLPSLTSLSPQHPRATSASGGSPSEKSSTLVTPTEVRFSSRGEGSGDEREEDHVEPPPPSRKRAASPAFVSHMPEHAYAFSPPKSPSPVPVSPPTSPSPTLRRPPSVLSVDKRLPPLPPDAVFTPTTHNHAHMHATLPFTRTPPSSPSFRDEAQRRQSFSGLTSRPVLPRTSTPPPHVVYDDFGTSRHSLAVERPRVRVRAGRFGLGALLGRKRAGDVGEGMGMGAGAGVGRRPLQELVQQDADFVAYRYPSKDERLDLEVVRR